MTPVSLPAPPRSAPSAPSQLYRDAASLASSSMITAVLGAGFWIVCARLIPPVRLGVQTALLSIIAAPAIVVASGVGDGFTAIAPVSGRQRNAVVALGYRLVIFSSLALGVMAALVATTVLAEVRGSLPVALLVCFGVVAWSLFVVQDYALTSLQRAHWLPFENGATSALKVALVPAAVVLGLGHPVVLASLLPCTVAVAVLFPQVRRLAAGAPAASDRATIDGAPAELKELVKRTTAAIAMSLGARTVTPFIVTAAAGPIQGAVFSLGLAIVQSLDFIVAALGVSLVLHASGAEGADERVALAVFKRTVAVTVVGAAGLIAIAPSVLHLLNPSYEDLKGARVIAILALGTVAATGYVIWSSLQRARRRMRALLVLNAVVSTLGLAAMVPVAARWGAVGAASTILAAQVFLSIGAAVHFRTGRVRTV